ncbi:tyrosine-type recombinase/integrase [Undibacterium sp. TJN19]|uniref:tyrosine-type recombinase/integrase n=1 Tax=Undibacterium sp. TJN19 TaxID=3413055 RepID=UPI003BF3C2C1
MHNFEEFDLEPIPALDSGDSEAIANRKKMFHDTGSQALINAETDSELARAFLYHAELAPTTLKSTKTELGRFLLWCSTRQLTLQGMRVEDLVTYREWLRNPQPTDQWVSLTRWPRRDPRWRPFSGPLSDPSVRQAFRVVKSLMTFATNAGYLDRNAGSLVKNIKTRSDARVTRYLSASAVGWVYRALELMPVETPGERRTMARERFLFITFLTTGARLSELVFATMGAVYTEDDGRWWLDVVGKGDKPRRLPVAPEMLASFRDYRLAFGLSTATTRDDTTPLVLNSRRRNLTGITDEAASGAIKGMFSAAADLAEHDGDRDAAVGLKNASTHWLRHTMLTLHANNGVALKTLQNTAGHASLSTTATYLHRSDIERHDELVASIGEQAAG